MKNKTDKLITKLFKKLFKMVGEKYPNDLTKDPEWYKLRQWTEKDEETFRDWAVEEIRKDIRCSKRAAKEEAAWFLLNYGWMVKIDKDL